MKIDIASVLESKLGRRSRFMPRIVVRWLERLIRQDELNKLLDDNEGRTGADFCRGALADMDVRAVTRGEERLPDASHRRVVYVCNHPLGGLDGLVMIDLLTRRHGGQVWFVVNDLLMFVEPLRNVFVPVNKLGGQSRQGSGLIQSIFAGNDPILVFPAGLVSRKGRHGVIRDLQWHKMCVTRAAESGRDIIPVHFDGNNSRFFYNFARLRQKSGIRFNLEMSLLPREMLRQRGARFTVTYGHPVPNADLARGGAQARIIADRLRDEVYRLGASNDIATEDYL